MALLLRRRGDPLKRVDGSGQPPVHVVGLGGSLRPRSSSLAALRVALAGAAGVGAETELLEVAELDLPPYSPETQHDPPEGARRLAEAAIRAHAMIWSSPLYQGSISGSFKNAIDWLQLLADREPPLLTDRVIGLISAAGGTQGLQGVNTMEFIVRAMRAFAVPLVVPVPRARQAFDEAGRPADRGLEDQLRRLGGEVTRAARQMVALGTCDYAECPPTADEVAAVVNERQPPGLSKP